MIFPHQKGVVISGEVRKSFTLIELLVVIAIISILMAMLLPALKVARDVAKAAVCSNNLKTQGSCVAFYVNDYGGYFPRAGGFGVTYTAAGQDWLMPVAQWIPDVAEYVGGAWSQGWHSSSPESAKKAFLCPAKEDEAWREVNYCYNWSFGFYGLGGHPLQSRFSPKNVVMQMLKLPSEIPLITDCNCKSYKDNQWLWIAGTDTAVAWHRHVQKTNVLWVDGHVQGLKYGESPSYLAPDISYYFLFYNLHH